VIEGSGALVNEKGEEQPLKAGDFALVNPDDKRRYILFPALPQRATIY